MNKKNDSRSLVEKQIAKCADDIKQRLATLGERDMIGRYEIGEKVQAFREQNATEKYAKRLVKKLAEAAGVNAMTLYMYADVARTWTRDEFRERAGRGSTHGLTFSHFVELSRVQDGNVRASLLETAIEKRLSVREVKAQIRPKRPRSAASKETSSVDLLTAADSLLKRASEEGVEIPTVDVEALRGRLNTMIAALEERARLLEEIHERGSVDAEAAQ